MSQVLSQENILWIGEENLKFIPEDNNLVKFDNGDSNSSSKHEGSSRTANKLEKDNSKINIDKLEIFDKLVIEKVNSINNLLINCSMIFYGKKGKIINYEGDIGIHLLINLLNMSPCYLVAHLSEINPDLDPDSLVFGFSISEIETNMEEEIKTVGDAIKYGNGLHLDYLRALNPKTKFNSDLKCYEDFKENYESGPFVQRYPYFADGRDDSSSSVTTIHPKAATDPRILANYIKKYLWAICNIQETEHTGKVITFVDDNQDFANYSKSVVHVINHEGIQEYFYKDFIDYCERTNLRFPPSEKSLRDYLLKLEDKKNNDTDVTFDEEFLEEYEEAYEYYHDITCEYNLCCGVGSFVNIPFNVQLEACALVVGVSVEEMQRMFDDWPKYRAMESLYTEIRCGNFEEAKRIISEQSEEMVEIMKLTIHYFSKEFEHVEDFDNFVLEENFYPKITSCTNYLIFMPEKTIQSEN